MCARHRQQSRSKAPKSAKSMAAPNSVVSEKVAELTPPENLPSEGGAKSRRTFAGVILVVFLAALLTGYLSGKAASRKYNQNARELILAYVTRSSAIEFPDRQVDRSSLGGVISASICREALLISLAGGNVFATI
jgi:hypothetical protein